MGTATTIADDLVGTAVDVLDQLARGVAPDLRLPSTLAGHRVDADAHADLVFTLGLLHATHPYHGRIRTESMILGATGGS